jgi:hypothetical protein
MGRGKKNIKSTGVKRDFETLFLETFGHIEKLIFRPTDYNHRELAGLLRKLLVDGGNLVTIVNQPYRLGLVFEVNERNPPPPIPGMTFWRMSIVPGLGPPGWKTKSLNLNQFLSFPCLQSESRDSSVRELIKGYANSAGAVHASQYLHSVEEAMLKENQASAIFGLSARHPLVEIAIVTLKAMEPLRQRIIEIPASVKQLCRYETPREGKVRFEKEQFLVCETMHESVNQFGFYSVVSLDESQKNSTIFAIGTKEPSSRILIGIDKLGCLIASVRQGSFRLTVQSSVDVQSLGGQPVILTLEIHKRVTELVCELLVGTRTIARASAPAPKHPFVLARSVMGADMFGKKGSSGSFADMILVSEPCSPQDRHRIFLRFASNRWMLPVGL